MRWMRLGRVACVDGDGDGGGDGGGCSPWTRRPLEMTMHDVTQGKGLKGRDETLKHH